MSEYLENCIDTLADDNQTELSLVSEYRALHYKYTSCIQGLFLSVRFYRNKLSANV